MECSKRKKKENKKKKKKIRKERRTRKFFLSIFGLPFFILFFFFHIFFLHSYRSDIGRKKKVRLAVLGSTRGTDLQYIIDSIAKGSPLSFPLPPLPLVPLPSSSPSSSFIFFIRFLFLPLPLPPRLLFSSASSSLSSSSLSSSYSLSSFLCAIPLYSSAFLTLFLSSAFTTCTFFDYFFHRLLGELNAEVAIVISNKSDAFILERAKSHSIPTAHISAAGKPREQFDTEATRKKERKKKPVLNFLP